MLNKVSPPCAPAMAKDSGSGSSMARHGAQAQAVAQRYEGSSAGGGSASGSGAVRGAARAQAVARAAVRGVLLVVVAAVEVVCVAFACSLIRPVYKSMIYNAWLPPSSAASNLRAIVAMTIDKQGRVEQLRVVQSSGNSMFDQSLMRAIRQVSPLPPLPEDHNEPVLR